MAGGFGPRFAVEAAFLLLLALFAGLADLRPLAIVGILAAGWVVVSLLEVALWRAEQRAPTAVYAEPLPQGEPPPEETEDDVIEEPLPEPEPYPLRADAGMERSEEAEQYTTILRDENDAGAAPAAADRSD